MIAAGILRFSFILASERLDLLDGGSLAAIGEDNVNILIILGREFDPDLLDPARPGAILQAPPRAREVGEAPAPSPSVRFRP